MKLEVKCIVIFGRTDFSFCDNKTIEAPSNVEQDVDMVLLFGEGFYLVLLSHIHHFGPDPW